MTSRERVLAAIAHKEADRVPIDFGGSLNSSINKSGYEKLKRYLHINEDKDVFVARGIGQCAKVDLEVQDHLGVDCTMFLVNAPDGWPRQNETADTVIDEFGMEWTRYPEHGTYETKSSPLFGPDVTLETVKNMKWPDPADRAFLGDAVERAKRLRASTDKAIIANLCMQIHTQSNKLRGFEDYLADMVIDQSLICSIMDRVTELYVERAKIIVEELGEYIDIVHCGDDLGSQTGPLFSLEAYRTLIKPRHKRLFEVFNRGGIKIMYHSCGSCAPFIDDLADAGVDILNPVQVSAQGMDTKMLKEKYGHKICFWCGIDSQQVLPFGSVKDVQEEVKRRLEDLAPGGGYVAGGVHNLRPEVPPENIVAMINALHEYGKY